MRRLVLAGFVSAVALVAASAQGTTDRRGLSSLTNTGPERIVVGAAMRAELRRAGAGGDGRILGRRDGKAFVEFARTGNGNCYGIRKRDASRFAFTCWSDFPSPAHPILDQSVYGADTGQPLHLLEAQGFAADGVAEIAIEDATGATIARTAVVSNVYSLQAPPATGVRLLALDAGGRVLFAVPR